MSHDATNWAIKQRGLKPAAKVVLWHLCDRYHPDHGCFPSQETLAADCEMSRSSLNEHLTELEAMGLIRREKRQDETTKRQKSTRYIFPFEDGGPQPVERPCPEDGHGAVSGKSPEPCPENGESRVRNPDTNLVREPVIEPPVRADARGEGFSKLWNEWPDLHRPDNRDAAATTFAKLSPADQELAVRYARDWRRLQALRGSKHAQMFPYLKRCQFRELVDAPDFDKDGDFIITPTRPEWSQWLGVIRSQYGERGVESALKTGRVVRKTRWPETESA
jgi:hypothetical protein